MKIYGRCTGREQDLLDAVFRNNSPSSDLNSQLNPFVLHGDNLRIVLAQNGNASESLIGMQNCWKHCIKYEWDDVSVSASSCEICVEPKCGYLRPGFTKLFRVTTKSHGWKAIISMIPIKCSIYHYVKENFREYSLPDGYFEYTERGYYEKVSKALEPLISLIHQQKAHRGNLLSFKAISSRLERALLEFQFKSRFIKADGWNESLHKCSFSLSPHSRACSKRKPSNWSPNCHKYLQSVYLNVNIRAVDSREIIKYATAQNDEHLMRRCHMLSRHHRLNALPTIAANDDEHIGAPKRKINSDEQQVMEMLIR